MKVFIHSLSRRLQGRSLLMVVLMLASGWVAAQTVKGTVYDETGFGLVGEFCRMQTVNRVNLIFARLRLFRAFASLRLGDPLLSHLRECRGDVVVPR